jgi:hypothetical protein
MSFMTRISNGWDLSKMSLATIQKNKTLLIFPVLSTLSMIMIIGSFVGGGFFFFGDEIEAMMQSESSNITGYAGVFLFYLVNYFIVIFFNTALMHCAVKTFYDEETTLADGISFSMSRIVKILGWTIVSATIGIILEVIANTGKIGQIVTAFMGIAWSLLTFFVVPILVFQDKGVIESIKDSGRMMKDKWGESLTMNMSFGLFQILGVILAAGLGFLITKINLVLGIAVAVVAAVLVLTVFAAAKTIFIAAVYNQVNGRPTGTFDATVLDSAFIRKN